MKEKPAYPNNKINGRAGFFIDILSRCGGLGAKSE